MRQDTKSCTHIKEVIDSIFTTSAVRINLDDIGIWELWDGVVGKKIAKHARPSSIKKGVLWVKVTDSIWLQELEFMTQVIKERINSKLQRQAIKKIRFRVGEPQDRIQTDKKRPRQEEEDDQDLTLEKRREMEEILARIKDKELRSSLRKIMMAAAKKGNIR
ncbi:MAG: DUF721 domain-containing protein [Desulfatiglandales bacterium]